MASENRNNMMGSRAGRYAGQRVNPRFRERDNNSRESSYRDQDTRDRGGGGNRTGGNRDHDTRDRNFRDGNHRSGPPDARDRGNRDQDTRDRTYREEADSAVAGGDDGGSKQLTGRRRKGRCKWFNVVKGWGFITPDDGGQEVFVHQHVIHMDGFRSLGENEDVEFEYEETSKGFEATLVTGPNGGFCYGSHRAISRKRSRKIRCYNCGEYGNHIAAKCKLGPMPKRCHHCKSEDHLIADCPQRFNKNSLNVTGDEFNDDPSNDVNSGMANLLIADRQ